MQFFICAMICYLFFNTFGKAAAPHLKELIKLSAPMMNFIKATNYHIVITTLHRIDGFCYMQTGAQIMKYIFLIYILAN